MNELQFTRRLTWVAAAACAVALAACGQHSNDGTTVGQKIDNAAQKTEQVAREGVDKAKDSMASAEDKMKSGSSTASQDVKDAGNKVATAVDDASITASVSASLAKDPDLSAIRIDVDTKSGNVKLQGPAPTAAAKDRATELAKNVKGVNSVDNQLVIKQG